jgi:hypothetical protein
MMASSPNITGKTQLETLLVLRHQYAGGTRCQLGKTVQHQQTPRMRGRNRDLYTNRLNGNSQSPQKFRSHDSEGLPPGFNGLQSGQVI